MINQNDEPEKTDGLTRMVDITIKQSAEDSWRAALTIIYYEYKRGTYKLDQRVKLRRMTRSVEQTKTT